MSTSILVGDALSVLREIPDRSVHCCVTSPPYWSLREYGGDDLMIGQEPTFERHLENLMQVFTEVYRVLRDDGTCWLNYGDRYDGKDLMFMPFQVAMAMKKIGFVVRSEIVWRKTNGIPESAKNRPTCVHEKMFLMSKGTKTLFWTHPIHNGTFTKPEPDAYWLNRDTKVVVLEDPGDKKAWSKRNWWTGHDYYYDEVSTMTPVLPETEKRYLRNSYSFSRRAPENNGDRGLENFKARNKQAVLSKYKSDGVGRRSETGDLDGGHRSKRCPAIGKKHAENRDRNETPEDMVVNEGANMRNVWMLEELTDIWSISTSQFKGQHFAVFPESLVEPCIKSGTSEKGACSKCGNPWVRQTEVTLKRTAKGVLKNVVDDRDVNADSNDQGSNRQKDGHMPGWYKQYKTLGWLPTCDCDAPVVPCAVLDPFSGSGTTGLVASRLMRNSILIEINADYAELAEKRIHDDAPMFADVHLMYVIKGD